MGNKRSIEPTQKSSSRQSSWWSEGLIAPHPRPTNNNTWKVTRQARTLLHRTIEPVYSTQASTTARLSWKITIHRWSKVKDSLARTQIQLWTGQRARVTNFSPDFSSVEQKKPSYPLSTTTRWSRSQRDKHMTWRRSRRQAWLHPQHRATQQLSPNN